MTPEDILFILAPPVRLVDYLERLFDAKTAKGEDVSTDWLKWLERWKVIRTDMASDIDMITPAEWIGLKEMAF